MEPCQSLALKRESKFLNLRVRIAHLFGVDGLSIGRHMIMRIAAPVVTFLIFGERKVLHAYALHLQGFYGNVIVENRPCAPSLGSVVLLLSFSIHALRLCDLDADPVC